MAHFSDNSSFDALSLTKPPEYQATAPTYLAEVPSTTVGLTKHPETAVPGYSTHIFYSSTEGGVHDTCDEYGNFDRKGTLAYYSEDRQKRFSLHTGGLSEAVLRFTVKLSSGRKKSEEVAAHAHCNYSSRIQGMVGDVYNGLRDGSGREDVQDAADRYLPWR